jgi:hypothetical protein
MLQGNGPIGLQCFVGLKFLLTLLVHVAIQPHVFHDQTLVLTLVHSTNFMRSLDLGGNPEPEGVTENSTHI